MLNNELNTDTGSIGNDNAPFGERTRTTQVSRERSIFMPRTRFENLIFTVIMAFIMVYAMIVYNISLNIGGLSDRVFLMALGELRIMWPVAIVLEMFVMEKPVMYLTGRVVTQDMPFIWMLLIRCSITVCLMCPAMSLAATILFKDFSQAGFVSTWIQTAAMNFPMALAWQIFFGGPLGRLVFRLIFRRQKLSKRQNLFKRQKRESTARSEALAEEIAE